MFFKDLATILVANKIEENAGEEFARLKQLIAQLSANNTVLQMIPVLEAFPDIKDYLTQFNLTPQKSKLFRSFLMGLNTVKPATETSDIIL